MSWFTKLFFKPKKKMLYSMPVPPKVKSDKPFKANKFLRFYDKEMVFYNETFARRSLETGMYMHVDEFLKEKGNIIYTYDREECFENFAQAYDVFCELEQKGCMDETQHLRACKSLVIMFNKQYSSIRLWRKNRFIYDYPKFFGIVQRMLAYDIHILIKADLYRQISMFKKSVSLLNEVYFRSELECEIRDEIRFRACNNVRYPFTAFDADNLMELGYDLNRPYHLDWFFNVRY